MSDDAVVARSSVPAPDPDHGVRLEVGAFGPWDTNAYLVWDGRSTDALILDPGMGAADPLIGRLREHRLRLTVIANSHGHIDHIFDDAPLMEASQAPLAIHPDDAYRLDGRNTYGFELRPVTARRDLVEGEQVRIGDLVFDVLHTPGHTEGSVCLLARDERLLFTGDTLFTGSWGRTDLPGGSDQEMVDSLARLSALPEDLKVLPGHGRSSTIADERPWLEQVARSRVLPF